MRTQSLMLSLLLLLTLSGVALAQNDNAAEVKAEAAVKKAETAAEKAEDAADKAAAARDAAAATKDKTDAAVTTAQAAGSKADVVVQQAANTLSLIQWMAFAFALLAGIAGYFGYRSQSSFQDTLNGYRKQLEEASANVREIERIRAELSGLGESLRREFEDAKQALVLLGLGNRVYDSGGVAEAIRYYEGARALLPSDPDINYRLGRAYLNSKRYDEAIKLLQKAVDARPTYAEAHMELGLAYRRHADKRLTGPEHASTYRLAEHHLKRAIDLRDNYADAMGTLAGLYRREGRYDDALDYSERAARADPDSTYGPGNAASVALFMGREDLAKEWFERTARRAEEVIPKGGEQAMWSLFDRALVSLWQGDLESALKDYRVGLAMTTSHDHCGSVLSNLEFLSRASKPPAGLDRVIELVKNRMGQGAPAPGAPARDGAAPDANGGAAPAAAAPVDK